MKQNIEPFQVSEKYADKVNSNNFSSYSKNYDYLEKDEYEYITKNKKEEKEMDNKENEILTNQQQILKEDEKIQKDIEGSIQITKNHIWNAFSVMFISILGLTFYIYNEHSHLKCNIYKYKI